jgi:uncharacterized protein
MKLYRSQPKRMQIPSRFFTNLGQLLLAPPLGEKKILAIDPGSLVLKIVCLDEKGDLLYNETIYPHAPQKRRLWR